MLTVKRTMPTISDVNRRTHRLVSAWLATQRSDNTRDAYRRDMASFARWCDEHGADALAATREDLDRYRDDCLASGASPATVTRRLSGVASFFRYANAAGTIEDNPAEAVARPDPESPGRAKLDDAELESLVNAAEELGPKTASLVNLLALDGLKLGEVLAIDVPSIRLTGSAVSVELQRRGEHNELEVSARTASAVSAYVAKRRQGPLFLSERPAARELARLSRFGADFLIKRAGAAAGIEKPVSASVLRRSYIGAAHRAGMPLDAIALQVGHKEVRETARMLEAER